MKLSIVLPAFNESKMIQRSLRAVQAAATVFTAQGWEVERIVCDNNSTDDTAELARAEGATVVFEPINQIARARNSGARAATGDWVLFVDADSFPSRELFQDLLAAIQSGKYLAGGAVVKLDMDRFLPNFVGGLWNRLSRALCWVAGSFIFCELATFREIGGFSEELYAAEEIELSKRLKKAIRAKGKKMTILHKHALLTSARKAHLYTGREHLKLFVRIVLLRGKPLRNREQCTLWYDGRR